MAENVDGPTPSWHASQAVASWDRLLAMVDRRLLAAQFCRGATEILRLGGSPAERQNLVDRLYEMGERHGLAVPEVQDLMAAATQSPPDRGPAGRDRHAEGSLRLVGSLEGYDVSPDGGTDSQQQSEVTRPLVLISPRQWRDVALPRMRWLATNRIPASDATILSGDGGGGKTTVALQLAVAVAERLGDWLGTVCEAGPVIFFSAEEPEHEMRRRLHHVARKSGCNPDDIEHLYFHFADPDKCLLGTARPNASSVPTPLFEALSRQAEKTRPALIVVDSVAATFGGNQNDRVHARTFVAMFRKLAQTVDCAILLLDHPSLSGITSRTGRGGSMDWQNAARARLHLETIGDEHGTARRMLKVKKTNYGPAGEEVRLQWEEGCFVVAASAPHQAAANATADQRYLECLDAVTSQGRHVCPSKGRGYAPKMFEDMPRANGMKARAFQAAQERLFAAGVIEVIPYGPPSKGAKCIARRV
jgi:RecA-family ATPase